MDDLSYLKNLLVKENCEVVQEGKTVLPESIYKYVNDRVDDVGTTRLMLAAKDGSQEYVELLLLCGADIDTINGNRRAVDYSLEGDHTEVTLLLLSKDSLLPEGEEQIKKLGVLMDQNDGIREFFAERDGFHETIKDGKLEDLGKKLKMLDAGKKSRCWVNSDGKSSLFTAARERKFDAWALLRAHGFAYATRDEEEDMEVCETDESFVDAIGRHFVEISGCHVQKMVAKSRRCNREGVEEGRCGEELDGYFRDIDGDEYTSDLLQCLQDDPSLQIIFDFSSSSVKFMHPLSISGNVWGLTDLKLNRIYAAAKRTEDFSYSDMVSNLVHELTHKVLAVVFENGGLPYRREEIGIKEEYECVVKKVRSDRHNRNCDKIILNVNGTEDDVAHELIVRVPEMISKYRRRGDGTDVSDCGITRLEAQAPELLEFYVNRVVGEIKECIERNATSGRVSRDELLRCPMFTTAYFDDKIQVGRSIEEAQPLEHSLLRILKVSNLKLAVSHLKASLDDVTFVDWTRYESAKDYFDAKVRRLEISQLAILWDKERKPSICRNYSTICTSATCIAKEFPSVAHRVVLVVPKKFPVLEKEKCIDYKWIDLSGDTRNWILGKRLCFGGREMELRDIIKSISGADAAGGVAEGSLIESLLGVEELAMLIDEPDIQIGRSLESTLMERQFELLRSHPECFISRGVRVRNLEFNVDVYQRRGRDVFFVRNARETDVKRMGIRGVCLWNENETQDKVRCFILSRESNAENEDRVFRGILRKLRETTPSGSNVGKWHFIHLFALENGKFVHRGSLNCRYDSETYSGTFEYSGVSLLGSRSDSEPNEALVIADAPGSGKSVFVNKTALDVKRKHMKIWVEVLELQLYEKQFEKLNGSDFASSENAIEFLYGLIKTDGSSLERKFFDLFCQASDKVFVFFDGFDEICPKYKHIVTRFLRTLLSSTRVRVCLTTRAHESTELEVHLSTLAYKLVPFNRAQQTKFLNLQWNASLKSMPLEERATKVERIITALQLPVNLKIGEGIPKLVGSLKSLLNEDQGAVSGNVEFDVVIEGLMERGENMIGDKVDFLEIPLHAWMLAYVVFEEDFRIGDSLSLTQLYRRFVDMKIEMYSKEKARDPGHVAGDTLKRCIKYTTLKNLKKFSAFFFLEDESCEVKGDGVHDMLRIGLVANRNNSNVFVHRTFGEYLLSLWLLDKCRKDKVTKVWMSTVLLKRDFQNVRQFIDEILLSGCENMSEFDGKDGRKSLLSRAAFPQRKEFVEFMQKCLYMSILECHEGILQLLVESSGDCLVDMLFGKADWDVRSLEFPVCHKEMGWNAFTFCGTCINEVRVDFQYCLKIAHNFDHENKTVETTRELYVWRLSGLDYLQFLPKLLHLAEKRELIDSLEMIISREGLLWMGFGANILWSAEIGKAQFKTLFEFLTRNKNVLAETVKAKMLSRDSKKMFQNAAKYVFGEFVSFLESILEGSNLRNLIVEHENFLDAWTIVFKECGAAEVERMWQYLEGRLEAPEDRKKILQRMDDGNRNAFFSAYLNWDHWDVLSFVWKLCQREMNREEFREYLHASFSNEMDSKTFKPDRLLGYLTDILDNKLLDGSEVTSLLVITDKIKENYLLRFNSKFSPSILYKFQQLLLTGILDANEILRHMKGQYLWLAPSCFEHSKWSEVDSDFASIVERQFQEMLPSLTSCPFVHSPHVVDDEGNLLHLLDRHGGRIGAFCLKTFLVVLRGQVKLDVSILGRAEVTRRMKEECYWIIDNFPPGIIRFIDKEVESKAFLIPYFFALLSECLSKEEVADILLSSHEIWRTLFHLAFCAEDDIIFYNCYDVARWAMGEDALWRVHVAGTGRPKLAVLDWLLNGQGASDEAKKTRWKSLQRNKENLMNPHLLSCERRTCKSIKDIKFCGWID